MNQDRKTENPRRVIDKSPYSPFKSPCDSQRPRKANTLCVLVPQTIHYFKKFHLGIYMSNIYVFNWYTSKNVYWKRLYAVTCQSSIYKWESGLCFCLAMEWASWCANSLFIWVFESCFAFGFLFICVIYFCSQK